jgi:hypothetical protein
MFCYFPMERNRVAGARGSDLCRDYVQIFFHLCDNIIHGKHSWQSLYISQKMNVSSGVPSSFIPTHRPGQKEVASAAQFPPYSFPPVFTFWGAASRLASWRPACALSRCTHNFARRESVFVVISAMLMLSREVESWFSVNAYDETAKKADETAKKGLMKRWENMSINRAN